MTARYSPKPVPSDLPPSARAWLQGELSRIAGAIQEVEAVNLFEQAAEPARLDDGLIAYADGSNWNPGKGEGIYCYVNAAWVSLSYGDLAGASNETISGDWTFTGTLVIPEAAVTDHEAALTITESQISDLGSYLENIVEDVSPQLGANLDVNGFSITSVTNGNVSLDPHGTGNVVVAKDATLADNTAIVFGTGSDFRVEYNGSALLFTPALASDVINFKNGTLLRVYDSADADYVEIESDGTDGRVNNSGGDALYFDNGVPGIGIKGMSLADDATGTWTLPDSRPGGLLFLTASSTGDNATGEYLICYVDDAATITTIASSAATISVGNGSNPDVDGDINVWSATQGIISVKNRRSATRRIQLYLLGC